MTDETTTARESLVAARKLRSCDRVILDALLDGSATAREISERVLMRSKEEWAARHDYFFEWDTDEEPLGAALLAHSEARKAGWVLMTWEIDGRLRALGFTYVTLDLRGLRSGSMNDVLGAAGGQQSAAPGYTAPDSPGDVSKGR